MSQEYPTAFLLCKALRRRQPSVLVSDGIAKRWLERHGGVRVQSRIENAGHLERDWGSNIREHFTADADPAVLATWMLTECGVSVPSRVCQSWLTRDWATAGGLRVCNQVEEQLGERLRLAEFKACFAGEAAAQALSEVLREREPFVRVSALVLLQWYSKYHPDSPAQRYHTAAALEEAMGDELRRDYAGAGSKALRTALRKRRPLVDVSFGACVGWTARYRTEATKLVGAKAVEDAVGARYRKEVTDIGPVKAMHFRSMKARLRTWGYEVSREACQDML